MRELWQTPSPLRPLRLDWPLLGGCLVLLALGLVMITSVTIFKKDDPYYYLNRQILHALVGALVALCVLLIPLKFWQSRWMCAVLLVLSFVMLGLLLVVGKEVNGAQRWFGTETVKVQPTELVKLLVVICLASYLLRQRNNLRTRWRGGWKPICLLVLLAGLLYAQPDFGSIVVLLCVVGGLLFLAGLRFRYLLALLFFGALLIALSLLPLEINAYRLERFRHAFNPELAPLGGGYPIRMAKIAFGSGGWFGVGLGNSVQKHFYLPEAHNDYILAILGEELGFVGVLACLGLFALIGLRAFYIGIRAERAGLPFAAYLAYGLALLWMVQMLVNFAVNLGAPAKGLALPFVSYGGSALVVCCASLGLLLRIDWESRQLSAEPVPEKEDELPDWLRELRYD